MTCCFQIVQHLCVCVCVSNPLPLSRHLIVPMYARRRSIVAHPTAHIRVRVSGHVSGVCVCLCVCAFVGLGFSLPQLLAFIFLFSLSVSFFVP